MAELVGDRPPWIIGRNANRCPLVGASIDTHKYMGPLFKGIEQVAIDPSFVVTHRLKLDEAPAAYKTFCDKKDECIKVVLTP